MQTPIESINKEKSVVALVRCETYDIRAVNAAVQRGLQLLGGTHTLCNKNEKLLLKLNILEGREPEFCISPHPSLFEAIVKVFKNAGAALSYGDSPGLQKPRSAAMKAGFSAVAERFTVPLGDFETSERVSFPQGMVKKSFPIVKAALSADGIISICKLKTHMLTRFTGAVKNQYGCIPGLQKSYYHSQLPLISDFCTFLVDITRFLQPRLYIMDGIMAMEGNGPQGGTPKKLNLLLLSRDPVALDAVACTVIDMNPLYVPTCTIGEKTGLGKAMMDSITLVGDPVSSFIDTQFDIVRQPPYFTRSFGPLQFLVTPFMAKPVIYPYKCVMCGRCVAICPVRPKALSFDERAQVKVPPLYDYTRCIRCFCCLEACPEKAIQVLVPRGYFLLSWLANARLLLNGLRHLLRHARRIMWKPRPK